MGCLEGVTHITSWHTNKHTGLTLLNQKQLAFMCCHGFNERTAIAFSSSDGSWGHSCLKRTGEADYLSFEHASHGFHARLPACEETSYATVPQEEALHMHTPGFQWAIMNNWQEFLHIFLKRLLKLSSFRKPNRPLGTESTLSSSYLVTANKA